MIPCAFLIFTLAPCLFGGETSPPNTGRLLWQIGAADDDFHDFRLAPGDYSRFLTTFPDDPLFVVGRSHPKRDWSYVHPGPADGWAGAKSHTFRILFALGRTPQCGTCDFFMDLVDTHGIRPPVLRIRVNDWKSDRPLPRGGTDAAIRGDPAAGRKRLVLVKFPASALKVGLNEISITTLSGSWFLYDWLALKAPEGTSAAAVSGTWIRSVKLDPWTMRRGDGRVQLLRVELLRLGEPAPLTVSTSDGDSVRVEVESGRGTIEIPLAPVEKETRTKVTMRSGGEVVFTREFVRKPAKEREPVDWVDPFLGTSTSRWMLYPGPSMPFGMVKLSPDNQNQGWKAGYEYSIEEAAGFSHLHSWTMGGLLTMPVTGPLVTVPGSPHAPDNGYRSRISHEKEEASPGYYSVFLEDYGIKAELTTTVRCGFQRYTFPEAREARILIDLDIPTEYGFDVLAAKIRKVSPTEIEGYSKQRSGRYAAWNMFTLHFVIRFSKPFLSFGGWVGRKVQDDVAEISGKGDVGAFVRYATGPGEVIEIKSGVSLVSIDQARLNLAAETDRFGWDFDLARRHARKTWNELLGKIRVEGGSYADKVKFYTNLYRSYCARTIWSDVDGKYVDMCEKVRQLPDPDSPVYGCDAFWNTFWNLNQLWTLVNPDIASRWVRSLLEIYDRGGWLPKGPTGIEYSSIMVASHEIALIVAAYQKGIRDFDVEKAWEAMKKIQTVPGRRHPCGGYVGNRQLASYMKYGYVPLEKGPVSNTLEYAYDDWCVAQMALALGKTGDYEYFMKRSLNYRNVFDPSVGYVRQKHIDGKWAEAFSPFSGRGYVEGNAWQYTWFVPHDVPGLIELMGKEEFNRRLNEGFERSRANNFNATGDRMAAFPINHGNQPNMQAAYLFNYSGRPWLTQKWAREIMYRYYGLGPYDGYPGDEDQGQMGAWFVMSAMGLFEMDGGCSVKPFYELGSPLFDKITITLDTRCYGGGEFVIETRNNSRRNVYIQSAVLNGRPLTRPWFYHEELVKGGKLVLFMGPEPNKKWGASPDAAPPVRHSRGG